MNRVPAQEDPPLKATERKALEKLVDNDFAALKVELQALAANTEVEREKEIRADFAARGADITQAQEETRALVAQFRLELGRLRDRYRALGVVRKDVNYNTETIKVNEDYEHQGLTDALGMMRREVNGQLQNAMRLAERERVNTQRQVLLASLGSPEALALVESIPSASDLLLRAQNGNGKKAITP